jgi:hypothetical protein
MPYGRSILEAHGGRLWATPNEPQGACLSHDAADRGKIDREARIVLPEAQDYQGASSACRPRMLRIARVAVAEAHLADHAEPGLRQWVTGEELEN